MKHLLIKIGTHRVSIPPKGIHHKIGILKIGILNRDVLGFTLLTLLSFGMLSIFSAGYGNDFSDVEKLLQNIPTEENKAEAEDKTGTSAATKSTAAKSVAAKSMTIKSMATKPIKGAAESDRRETAAKGGDSGRNASAVSRKSASEFVDEGWVTIQPNAPGTVIPAPKVAAAPPKQAVSDSEDEEDVFFGFSQSDRLNEKSPSESDQPAAFTEPDAAEAEKTAQKESESAKADELFEEAVAALEEESSAKEIPAPSETKLDSESISEKEDTRTKGNAPAEHAPANNTPTLENFFEEKEGAAVSDEPEPSISEPSTTITEPKKVGESRETFSVTPSEHDSYGRNELETALEGLASEPGDGESLSEEEFFGKSAAEEETVIIPDFDSGDEETIAKVIDASRVGDPHAQDKLRLMYDEIINGMRTRNVTGRYEMWKGFSKGVLRDTAGINTSSELDGRNRLSWYQKLYADPIHSPFDTEKYSRELFSGLSGSHRHFAELMPGIRERMDVPNREDTRIEFPLCTTPMEALVEVKRCLLSAASFHAKALATLTPTELESIERNFVETFVGRGCESGHTIPARSVGRRLVDMLDKMDKAALYDGAEALVPLTNTALLDLLLDLPDDALPEVMMSGQRFQRLSTAAGDIIIGGRGRNVYDLDSAEMRHVICVISRGEDDTFREGSCNLDRPIMVIIAAGKKNTFVGTKPGIQGGSVMGISMLLDRSESSTYIAGDVAQGSTMGGVGILINYGGSNSYKGLRRVQGHALLGLGMLIDKATANTSYKASMWAQGFGAPGGFGLLHDGGGNNHYYCGGFYLDSYPEHPGYDGWGQGIGAGIRQVANGGVGIILSGSGNDVYEVDYFGHGGGYWLGVGIARDFGGDDVRHGTTLTTYGGTPRTGNGTQPKWTRFANGFGCHYALGFCFDDNGYDTYGGRIMGTGMAWDLAFGTLCDFNGGGKYTATGNQTQGVGAEGSIGVLYSYGGDDTFASRSQGLASPSVTYHPPACGGNFSFMINHGGDDRYGSRAANNSFIQRGTANGFLIDRPTEKEASEAIAALREAIDTRNQEIVEYDAMIVQMREEAAKKRQRFYPPRQRRPRPIAEDQLIGAVPDFDVHARSADASKTPVK